MKTVGVKFGSPTEVLAGGEMCQYKPSKAKKKPFFLLGPIVVGPNIGRFKEGQARQLVVLSVGRHAGGNHQQQGRKS